MDNNNNNISWWRNYEGILKTFYPVFLGQVVSFVMALMSFTSSLVANLGKFVFLDFYFLGLKLVVGVGVGWGMGIFFFNYYDLFSKDKWGFVN